MRIENDASLRDSLNVTRLLAAAIVEVGTGHSRWKAPIRVPYRASRIEA